MNQGLQGTSLLQFSAAFFNNCCIL